MTDTMKKQFLDYAQLGVLASALIIGCNGASAGERQNQPSEPVFHDGGITVKGLSTEKIEELQTLYRRIVHVAEKLKGPKNATTARGFFHEMLRSAREDKSRSAKHPAWIERMMRDSNPVDVGEQMRKMLSAAGEIVPGAGLVQAYDLDKKMMERVDRVVWDSGCGNSPDCLVWTAARFVKLEREGSDTANMRRFALDLDVLPTNSTRVAYGEPSAWGKRYGSGALEYIGEEIDEWNGYKTKGERPEIVEAQEGGDLIRIAEETLGHKLSREGLEARIAEVPTEREEKARGGPLWEYQQWMKERIERELRADFYASLGTFVSFANPELGRVIAVGFPAVERLWDGVGTILRGGAMLATFGDVLGGAAALTKLVASLSGSEDALSRNIRMIQKGLETVSRQVRTVDRKVDFVIERLDEVAATLAKTHEEVRALGLRMETMHRETMRQFARQSRDIHQIGRYLIEVQRNELLDRVADVETCVQVNEELLLHTGRNDRVSEHLRCREKAFGLALDQAARPLYTGLVGPQDLWASLEDARPFDAADAHWLASHWRDTVETVVSSKVEARNRPTRFRGVFKKHEKEAPAHRTAVIELSAMRDESVFNPMIWYEAVEKYVRLERQRGLEVPANDQMTRKLIASAGQMKNLVRIIEDENLAYGAMELHLWNGHLLVQVLRGLWSEYLRTTKKYRFSTCTEAELEEATSGTSSPRCYADWSYGWLGNDDLVFGFWLNDYNEALLPIGNHEKIQAMVRILRANDGETGVESEVRTLEVPRSSFDQNVNVVMDSGNFLNAPEFWKQVQLGGPVNFPAIYGDVSVSWTGCLTIVVEHRIAGRRPFGMEAKWSCVGDDPKVQGSVRRWRQFVGGGPLKLSFRPPRGEKNPTWCQIWSDTSFLRDAEFDGRPMVAENSFDGSALIRNGSLVLNQIGLTPGWDEPDKSYTIPEIKKDAFRLVRYAFDDTVSEDIHGRRVKFARNKCNFSVLWGTMVDLIGFFPDTLYVDKRYPVGDPLKIPGHYTNREDHEVVARRGMKHEENYREYNGAMLLFNATRKNVAYLKRNLARLIYQQEVEKIFDTVKQEMVTSIRTSDLGSSNQGEALKHQKVVADVGEYKIATQAAMAQFLEWATDKTNMRKKVELDWHEVVGYPASTSFRASLADAIHRLDDSWRAVQVLSRIVAGACTSTPGGVSFEELSRRLASGKDVITFLKSDSAEESRFRSWSELQRFGLLGVSSSGLAKDAARLRAKVGPLDTWPLQTEVWMKTNGRELILLASLDAAMALAREAARRSGVVISSKYDPKEHELEALQDKYGPTVVEVARESGVVISSENDLHEHEVEAVLQRYGRAVAEVPRWELRMALWARQLPFVIDNIDAKGVPIAWLLSGDEESVLNVVAKNVSMTLLKTVQSEEAGEVGRQTRARFVRQMQSIVSDILSGRTCRPGIHMLEDGTKQLQSIVSH